MSQHHSEDVHQAARIVASGGVIAHPTEGVYGLACAPTSTAALERILCIKDRDRGKGVILMAHDVAALLPYCAEMSDVMLRTLARRHEHPTTYIVPAASSLPDLLTGGRSTLAVRVTRHAFSRALCAALNTPIVSTSANRGGQTPARDAHTVQRTLGDDLDLIVDAPLGDASGPSTIIDITSGSIIRPAPDTESSS